MFRPNVTAGGLVGWRMLQATMERQSEAFSNRVDLQNELRRFDAAMSSIRTTEELVGDRSALKVALGAHDLGADLNNRFFIKRVLDQGTDTPKSLANRLQDDRYRSFAQRFDPAKLQLGLTGGDSFREDVAADYLRVSFEQAVGEIDPDMRLALGLQRLLPGIAQSATDDAAWFRVMANPPVRDVMQTALGLPRQVSGLDIDQQLDLFKSKADQAFGTHSLSDLAEPDRMDAVLTRFFVRRQAAALSSISPMQAAVTLLASVPRPA